ncbi:type IV conjugative transfer system coupling protein TraD [Vibrio sp. SCSIO 43169]|uniref:type IV conjugative transfer system coupling protein TraD n=1 Tax=Vibrio sp. SCSIO 43169 TaxID=2822801 RepID=UPI002044C433|nr:type IV conjugative transfer system coupling protein TraD [Vibrio sp. SCSIO 43169]MCM5511344.1 type IV conjugative transfer system coupling protein TraD [Vibrio sp. SCSIO 43169]
MTRLINLFYALRTVQFNGQLGATLTIALGVEMVMVVAFHALTSVSGDLWRLEGWYWRVHALYWLGASTQQIVAVSDASQAHTWTLGTLMRSPFIELGHARFWRQFGPALELAVGVGLLTMMSFVIIMIRLGVTASRDRLIRGGKQVPPAQLEREMHRGTSSPSRATLCLGGFDVLHPHFERQHVRIEGTTGSGKSVLIREFLAWIRARGDRAVVYDKGCSFVGTFYRPETDVLLNPYDARSVNWDLWADATDAADFEHQASALIPASPQGDPFWNESARSVFASVARQLRNEPRPPTTERLLALLTTSDLTTLSNFLANTEAATYVSKDIKKTALSIQTVLTTYARSLRCLQGLDRQDRPAHLRQRFSITDWVRDDSATGFMFLTSHARHHVALRPLISLWLAIASNAILGLSESHERRLWVILDELPSLQQLPELASTLAEVRKFGGCFVISLQSHAQLIKNYGSHDAQAICDLLNSRFFFRSPSHAMAKVASQELGEQDIDVVRHGQTLTPRARRDARSRNLQRLTRPIITPTQIQALPDLHCFVRSPGTDWVAKLVLPYVTVEKAEPDFVPRPPSPKIPPSPVQTREEASSTHSNLGALYD